MPGMREFLGRGLSFPPAVDPATGRFLMAEAEDDIRQAIYLILMTRKGERVMLPEFGCAIHDYVFDLPDTTTTGLIATEIVEALTRWEPRVTDIKVDVDARNAQEGKIIFEIMYTVRDTNSPGNLVFPYYLYEGVGRE